MNVYQVRFEWIVDDDKQPYINSRHVLAKDWAEAAAKAEKAVPEGQRLCSITLEGDMID